MYVFENKYLDRMFTYEVSRPKFKTFLIDASRIDPTKISVAYILKTMKKAEQMFDNDAVLSKVSANKARLGMFWAQTIASCMGKKSVIMTGQWESVLRTMITLVSHWRPEHNMDSGLKYSDFFKPWVLKMFTDHKLCPNPYLRLEMFRFICMCPDKYLQDANYGMQVVEGFVVTSAYMKIHHFDPVISRNSIGSSFDKVFRSLTMYGYLNAVTAAAVHQVRSLKIGPEASFFNHIVQLLGQVIEASRVSYFSSSLDYSQTIKSFTTIVHLFKLLVATPSTMAAYEVPGLAQAAATSLVSITSSLVSMNSTLKHDVIYFSWVLTILDGIYEILSTPFSRVVGLNHAQLLSSLNKQVAESGFCFNHFPIPCEESTEDSPEKFVDSLTQAVMEAPVLLHSSKMVVDESTLVQMLLMSTPSDPFTRCPLDYGSYSRLPDLQADIVAWRNSTIGDSSCDSDVNSVRSNDNEITRENDSITRNIDNIDSRDYVNSIGVDERDCELRKLLLQFSFSHNIRVKKR